jgi:carbon-monoxide dehydrogenase large subunit
MPWNRGQVVGEYNPKTEHCTVDVGTQGVSGHRNALANALLKVPLEKVRVISQEVGGSFGMKGTFFAESALVLFAARKLGRTVKWCADRSESFMADYQGRGGISPCWTATGQSTF